MYFYKQFVNEYKILCFKHKKMIESHFQMTNGIFCDSLLIFVLMIDF